MNYREFREQCAVVCDEAKKEISPDYIIGEDVRDAGIACCENIAKRIRALPLPESKLFGWIQFVDGRQTQNFARDEMELATMNEMVLLFAKGMKVEYIPVFSAPPDADALRKENAELREVLELAKRCLDDNLDFFSETIYETMKRIDAILKGGA